MNETPFVEKEVVNLGLVKFRPYLTIGMVRDIETPLTLIEDEKEKAKLFSSEMIKIFILEPTLSNDRIALLTPETVSQLIDEIIELMDLEDECKSLSIDLSQEEKFYQAYVEEGKKLTDQLAKVTEQASASIKVSPSANLASLFKFADTAAAAAKFAQSFSDISKVARNASDLYTMGKPVADLISKFSEPFLSSALITSNIHTASLHTTAYPFPEVDQTIFEYENGEKKAEEVMRRRLVEGYDILTKLEQSIREIIQSGLFSICGDQWWKQRIPGDVRNDCDTRKKEKEKPHEAQYHPLTYSYIHDYRKIILRTDNWKDIFEEVFHNKTELEACFNWVGDVRDPIAHARPVGDEQYVYFVTAAKWIQSHIEAYNKNKKA